MKLKSAEFFNGLTATFEQMTVLSQGSANANQDAVNRLSAVFEQINTLTYNSVAINQNIVTAELGSFVLFAAFLDTFYVQDGTGVGDGAVLEFFKTLTDDTGVADLAAKAVNKAVADPGYVIDNDIIRFTKNVFETIPAADSHSFDLTKPLNDIVSGIGDHAFLFAKKVQEETIGIAESVTKGPALGKSDSSVTSDDSVLAISKPFSHGFSVAELQTLAVAKVLADDAAATEDSALLTTGKLFTDSAGATDNDVLAFVKALLDHGFVSDAIDTLRLGKSLSDAAAASDAIDTFGFGKILHDTVDFTDDVDGAASILDDQEMQFQKVTTNLASVSEFFERQVNFIRDFSDTASVGESINVITGKQVYDIPVVSETLAKSFTKAPFLDSALLGDATVVSPVKVILDLASITDAGSLRSQGYSDFTYFAEDFVGASTTF